MLVFKNCKKDSGISKIYGLSESSMNNKKIILCAANCILRRQVSETFLCNQLNSDH